MRNILINIRKTIFFNRKLRNLIAASNLEKKAINLNIKSEEYVKSAKQRANEWKKKWSKVIK